MIERDETRERFLAAIAERLEPSTIAEAHLFPPIRQGGLESGVAVVAVRRPGAEAPPEPEAAAPAATDAPDDYANDFAGVDGEDSSLASPNTGDADAGPARLTVYTAKYRLTLKGPERGKWEFALQAEADAPLLTVDKVVRGVQQRSGDAEDPVKLPGDEFRALLPAASPAGQPPRAD